MAATKSATSAPTKPTPTKRGRADLPSGPSRPTAWSSAKLSSRATTKSFSEAGCRASRPSAFCRAATSWSAGGSSSAVTTVASRRAVDNCPTVDTIDCVAFKAGVRRTAARWAGGEVIEVRGELRRRFWRGAQGAASRCEVEVLEIKKISAAP